MISKSTYDPYCENKGNLSKDLLNTIEKEYNLELNHDSVKDLGGSYNRNVLLETNKGKFVARLYQSYTMNQRLADIQKVRKCLNISGIPTSKIIPTISGNDFTCFDNKLLEVEYYVEKHENMNTWKKLLTGIKMLGKIHDLLKKIKVSEIGRNPMVANHIEIEYALPWTIKGINFIKSISPTKNEQVFCKNAQNLAQQITKTQTKLYPKLPRQLVHGDYWDNNVFIHGNKIDYIGDFDFMGERARIDDIALTIFFMIASTKKHYSTDFLKPIKKIVNKYDESLETHLADEEKMALPLAIARVPLAFVGIIPAINSRKHVSKEIKSRAPLITWALQILNNLDIWQKELSS